jgi:ATP-dependent HslUV protease ATP-binding subunit HslU
MKEMTPEKIAKELDKYIVGQDNAKRAVAIAVRNRWRRMQLPIELKDEVVPKNILMIGPTGVGKTEIARRLARLVAAPFIKVEATKFTEVGYMGKDVESMVRELVDLGVKMVKEQETIKVQTRAKELAEERVLDLLVPSSSKQKSELEMVWSVAPDGTAQSPEPKVEETAEQTHTDVKTREKFQSMLRAGKMDDRDIELDVAPRQTPVVEIIGAGNMEEMGMNIREMFGNLMPKNKKRRRVNVKEALELLCHEEAEKLLDMDAIIQMGVDLTEENGIIFLDEMDKIAGRDSGSRGPDVSREGVQRDILPIVEGSSVNTKYGMVNTDHVLFIASGAFHTSKPSDLMPELQGRFPIRVELNALTKEDFLTILKVPQNSLTRQYTALMNTEGVKLDFTDDGLEELANYSALVNERTENIGARRLHTIMETVLDEISYDAPNRSGDKIKIDAAYVKKRLQSIADDTDLSRYIL